MPAVDTSRALQETGRVTACTFPQRRRIRTALSSARHNFETNYACHGTKHSCGSVAFPAYRFQDGPIFQALLSRMTCGGESGALEIRHATIDPSVGPIGRNPDLSGRIRLLLLAFLRIIFKLRRRSRRRAAMTSDFILAHCRCTRERTRIATRALVRTRCGDCSRDPAPFCSALVANCYANVRPVNRP